MKAFLDKDFLLQTASAQKLYHEYAAQMPIVDYHCHLSPKDIAEDRQFDNLTQVWLYGDHYKWRGMRTNGIEEKYCTGEVSDYEKFEKWAATVPYTLRNPLYHWTHLELQRYFGINKILNPSTAKEIYDEASALLRTKAYSVRNLLRKMNVQVVCTTDDPIDSLEYHQQLKADGFEVKVVPAWRPDKAMAVDNLTDYNQYLALLEAAAKMPIVIFSDLIAALRVRHDFFHANGARLSDHGLDTFFAEDYTQAEIDSIFLKARSKSPLTDLEVKKFKSAMLYEFSVMDAEKNWVQQFHVGAQRNNNTRSMRTLGADTGFDSIGDVPVAQPMGKFLARLDDEGKLAKTILYNLNPADNEVYATMLGNFQGSEIAGKIQWGAAWWFLDQKFGMERHLDALSPLGLLSRFVGMLTDSRSFLSFPRHEYFRRVLCNVLGNDIENGEIPADFDLVGGMVQDISYRNARSYFSFWE